MKYSIIIPHLNEGFLLDIMLDSIYNQFHYDNFEIIIVDDGSNDISHLDFIKTHFLKDKITVYFETGLGSSMARNHGASKASGDYLIFLDSHMYFRDDFLTKLHNILISNDIDSLQPVIGSIKDKKLGGQIYKIKDYKLNSTWDTAIGESDLIETPNLAGGATVIKKHIFDDIGGFNVNFIKWGAEDLDFSCRLLLRGYKSFLSKKLFVAHYFKESFTNTEIKTEQVLNNKIMFAYTFFNNPIRLERALKELQEYYGEIFNELNGKVLLNETFKIWLKREKESFVYDDNWYFEKFGNYYLEF